MRYETEASWTQYDAEAERRHGPVGDCEVYYNRGDATASEICLVTGEREDFESELDIKLSADVLHQDIFNLLLAWINKNDLLHKERQ